MNYLWIIDELLWIIMNYYELLWIIMNYWWIIDELLMNYYELLRKDDNDWNNWEKNEKTKSSNSIHKLLFFIRNFIIPAGTMNLARITSVTHNFLIWKIFIILARITDINRLDTFGSNLCLYCIIVKFSKIELWIKNVTIRTDYLTVISQITWWKLMTIKKNFFY